ncbi:MAG: sensor histidine kinase [Gammaproteobacteria bacterium]
MGRAESTALDSIGTRQAEAPELRAALAPAKAVVVDRLIGDQPARWWPLAGSWLAVAFSVGFGLFVNYQNAGRPTTFFSALMAMIPHYVVWLLASPPLYRALHMAIQGHRRLLWLASLAAWSLVALLGSTGASFLSYAIRRDLPITIEQLYGIYFQPPAGPAFNAMNLSILALALAAFAVVRGLRLRDHALWEATQAALHGARLEAQLAEARLQALQAQINPHFLLNSLNAVAGLVQTGERDRAFDAIGRIGELLQVALRSGRTPNMTLGDEMEFLDRYLKLCELRFEHCFRYRLAVPESLCALRIPALVVQPLIENSIRHGMDPPRLLTVDIRAWREDGRLVIEVEDDGRGPGVTGVELRPGHGLANVAERLRLFYGAGSSLLLEPRAPAGTRVRLACPL